MKFTGPSIPIPIPRHVDMRTRADRKKLRADAFAAQMGKMTDAYMLNGLSPLPKECSDEDTDIPLLADDELVSSAFVRQGLIPTAPYSPGVVITVRAVVAFREHELRVGGKAYVHTHCERRKGGKACQVSLAFITLKHS
ncbi:hypothetical protein C8R45DRAFT_1107551 [Mycena sanguinolenta]|nr:hypothetical protein C8R45DRAFT_1107551 [Mycena sanguinolenta]